MENMNLNVAADETYTKLTTLWDEIGVDPEERREQLLKMKAEVNQVFTNSLKAEQSTRDGLTQNILRLVNELLSIAAALGESVQMDESVGHLPLRQRFGAVKEKVEHFEKKKELRCDALRSMHAELQTLWADLGSEGLDALKAIGEDLSTDRVKLYSDNIEQARAERTARLAQIKSLTGDIMELWDELAMPADTELDKSILRSELKPTLACLGQLTTKRQQLTEEKQFRENEIKKHAKQISVLWTQLNVPEAEQEAFFARHSGLGPAVLQAVRAELTRLEELKVASMKQLIVAARAQLEALWNELHVSQEERAQRFARLYTLPSLDADYTEELLQTLQVEITRVQDKLKEYRPIISLIEKREALRRERAEMDAAAADPTRLLSKSREQAARLLKEEKQRKTIARDLPSIEQKLRSTLAGWEKQYQQIFSWNGHRYLDVLDQEEEAERKKKEDDRVRRETQKAARVFGGPIGTAASSSSSGGGNNSNGSRENISSNLKTPTKAISHPPTKIPLPAITNKARSLPVPASTPVSHAPLSPAGAH